MNRSTKSTIVIVEDDPLVRESFKDCLESADYLVRDFGSAEEFLVSNCAPDVDGLILDVMLPGIDGLELHRKLIELGMTLPVVYVTAHGNGEICDQAVALGAAGFLKKPVNRTTLLGTIDRVLRAC